MKEIYLPSAPHQTLAALAGAWEQTVELASASGPPVRATGPVTNRVVVGGRFLLSEGTARQAGGPLELGSMLVFGFDGRTREYTSIVFDTFGTYYVTASGPPPGRGMPLVMHGETPERGGTKRFDVVLRWIDDDTYRVEIVFHLPGRESSIAVAATCRRVRSPARPAVPRPVTFHWRRGGGL